jgi:hypothetical protein
MNYDNMIRADLIAEIKDCLEQIKKINGVK